MTTPRTLRPRTPAHGPPLPVLRAAVFAVVGTALGVSAHHLVTEGPAPWRHGTLAAAALFGVGLVGARRPRSLASVVTVCAAAQAGLHLWLTTAPARPGPPAAPAGHLGHAAEAPRTWHGHPPGSPTMTAVHIVAALLVAVLLHRADTVCWSLARGLDAAAVTVRAWTATARALCRGLRVPAEPGPPAPVFARPARRPPEESVLAGVVVRRGPPRGAAHPRPPFPPGRRSVRPLRASHTWRHPCSAS
ncbi:hypothetical protein ACFV5G_36025 [Streptomyces sp. NPDC059766]|uniref:hypothetical protein n=1 Tax=Streptomyces sp. NPDC059766 TaxID=3346940 RepID=UPI003664D62B